METEAQGGDQEGAPQAAQVTVPAPMPQGLPIPVGGVRGEGSRSQGLTVDRLELGQWDSGSPAPVQGPGWGRPQAQEGQQGQRVSTGWAWSLPGLVASQQELRSLSGDPALCQGPGLAG